MNDHAPVHDPAAPDRDELEQALALLRRRLDKTLVDRLDQGDLAEGLLTHLRQRQTPRLLFSPENLPVIAQQAAALVPDEHAWEKRIADEAISGRVYAASNPHCERFVELDPDTFDFSRFDHFDKEALHGLNRHRWYAALARTYWDDQDRAYFDALIREWDFFARVTPAPDQALLGRIDSMQVKQSMVPPYGELDSAIRLTSWWWAYWVILHAKELTPDRNAVLLARCLKLFDRVAGRGVGNLEHNFTSMHMEAIYFWASALPEAVGMHVWKHAARNTLTASLSRAVWPDGVHWEQSTGYHSGCIRWYGTSYLLGQRNGEQWGEGYRQRLRKMGEHLDAIITPDGCMPLRSDSDRTTGWKGALGLLRSIVPDIRYRHPVGPSYLSLWASDGMTWDPATTQAHDLPEVRVFPDAGLGVARHHDPQRGAMVLLENGPQHAGHAHAHNLSVHYDAEHLPILVDPGRWIYTLGPDRRWVLAAPSHNAIHIEDQPYQDGQPPVLQKIATSDDPRVSPIQTYTAQGVTRLVTRLQAYSADPAAGVQRTVIMPMTGDVLWLAVIDKIQSPTPHTWTNSWLLPAAAAVQQGGEADHYTAALESGAGLELIAVGSEPLVLRDQAMFWCPNYAEKSPARWLGFSSSCEAGWRAFLFVPTGPGKTQDVDMQVKVKKNALHFTVGKHTWSEPRD